MAVIRVRRVEGAPVVAVRLWLRGGSTCENRPGQALLSGRLQAEGTRARSWQRIAHDAERRGAGLTADAGYEAQGLAVDALADDWERALDWIAELALESVFPEDRCRWLARQAAAELEQMADHPDVKTSWAFDAQLFGSSARGRPLQGDAESLAGLTGAACKSFHRACVERGAIIAVAGAIPEAAVEARARELFADLADSRDERDSRGATEVESPHRQRVALDESGQAHWFGGAVTAGRGDADYWPLSLLGIVLGAAGNLSGRISNRVREVEGLAYSCGISTVAGAGRDPGCFAVAIGTSPERVDDVEQAVRQELERLVESGVSASELADARDFVLGRAPFQRETARQWAGLLAQAELFEVPIDDADWVAQRWRDVTLSELGRVARRYLDPARLKVTVGSSSVTGA